MIRAKSPSCISYRIIKNLNFNNVRNFHLTHCIRLRRIPVVKQTVVGSRNVPHVQTVVSGFRPPENMAVNKNFYGIESDEGVTYVEQSCDKNATKYSQKSYIDQRDLKFEPTEKVKKTRFGNVRWDGENKPVIHGQYEGNSNTEIDYPLHKFKNVVRRYAVIKPGEDSSANSLESKQFSINIRDMKKHAVEASKINELKYCDQPLVDNMTDNISKVNNNEIPVLDQEMKSKNVSQFTDMNNADNTNFIDEFYFQQKDLNLVENRYTNSRSMSDLSQNEMFSPVVGENLSFSHVVKDSNAAIIEEKRLVKTLHANIMENKNNEASYNNSKKEKNGSFIDENYFGDKLSDESNTIIKNSVNEQNVSFIDEGYFGEKLSHLDNDSIRIINEEVYPNKEVAFENEKFYDDLKSSDTSPDNSRMSSSNYSPEHKLSNESERIYKPKEQNESLNAKNNLEINSSRYEQAYDKHLNAAANLFNQEMDTLNNQKSHVQGDKNMKGKSNLKKLLKANFTDMLVRNETKPNGTVSIESSHLNKFTVSQPVLEKNDATDIKTAYDFVNKLRKEKKQTEPKIKGGKILPGEEKVDSKGFRILTNQVPNLQYFTREEVLSLLKNNILYADDDLLILNKPYNMVMHESKTTNAACLSEYLDELAIELDTGNKDPKLLTVHRLDKETCGCLLLARNETSADRLKSLFAQRKIIKSYWIVTSYVPDPEEGVIDIPIAEGSIDGKARMVLNPKIPEEIPYESHAKYGKRAVTHYKVIATAGNAALVEVQPETGIKHQIRVHFGFGLSCPILGDHKYSHLSKFAPQKLPSDMLQRLQIRQSKVRHIPMHIYARSVLIPRYNEGKDLFVMAPMPTHMSINLQRLKFKKN